MLVGVPKEIKDNEFRVGLVPPVAELTAKATGSWSRRVPESAPAFPTPNTRRRVHRSRPAPTRFSPTPT